MTTKNQQMMDEIDQFLDDNTGGEDFKDYADFEFDPLPTVDEITLLHGDTLSNSKDDYEVARRNIKHALDTAQRALPLIWKQFMFEQSVATGGPTFTAGTLKAQLELIGTLTKQLTTLNKDQNRIELDNEDQESGDLTIKGSTEDILTLLRNNKE